ncbi:hypothetical protein BS47DRAFT_439749 [Hydnum rufescens UP504]|uniref:Uncharacterized protein n=1 Tax=Hydnum rufescens UP504 TaxID=1448309 RepID=A0A9P6B573_9AGAM|nr:hypothetical protein BS47DRAFT_439749 [Hydnum rufescens UP504]
MYTPPMAPRLGTIPLPIIPTPAVMTQGYPTPPGTPPHEFQSSLFPTYNPVAPDPHYPAHPSAGPQHNVHDHYGHRGPVANGNALGLYFPNGSPSLTPQGYYPEPYSQPAAPMPQTSPEHPYSISPADAYWRLHFNPNNRSTYPPAPTTPTQYASSSSSSHPAIVDGRGSDGQTIIAHPGLRSEKPFVELSVG